MLEDVVTDDCEDLTCAVSYMYEDLRSQTNQPATREAKEENNCHIPDPLDFTLLRHIDRLHHAAIASFFFFVSLAAGKSPSNLLCDSLS